MFCWIGFYNKLKSLFKRSITHSRLAAFCYNDQPLQSENRQTGEGSKVQPAGEADPSFVQLYFREKHFCLQP